MPDQKICASGQRTAELREFERLAARCYNCPDRQQTPAADECCEFNRLSTATFISKDFSFDAQSHVFAKLKPSPAVATAPDSAVKPKTTSPKIALRRAPLKNARPALSLKVAARAVKSDADGNLAGEPWTLLQQSPAHSAKASTKLEKLENHNNNNNSNSNSTCISSGDASPQLYRGVRQRPGVKGYLVEIRPRRWKTTIWLGTYTTLSEAALAYDAGIFYTGKSIPFNFEESEGSFPPLPEYLSLADFRAENMDKVKSFVKEQALKAARRAKRLSQAAGTLQQQQQQQQVCKEEDLGGHNHMSSSCEDVQGSCVLSFAAAAAAAVSASEKKKKPRLPGYVKEENCDGWTHVTTPNAFQTLGPLPVQVLLNEKCCCGGGDGGGGGNSAVVQGPCCVSKDTLAAAAAAAGDQGGLKSTKQASCFVDNLLFEPSHVNHEESMAADNSLHLVCCSTNDGNLGTQSAPYSTGCQCFDHQSVQDPFAINGLPCSNVKAHDTYHPQLKSLCDFAYATTQPNDPMGVPLSADDLSFMSSCKYLSYEDPNEDDDNFPILLWSYACGSRG